MQPVLWIRHGAALFSLVLATSAHAQARVVSDVDYIGSTEQANPKHRVDIYIPDKATRAPVIVSLYGGALREGDKSQQKFVGQRFVAAGFVTVVINYRLTPEVTHPAHVQDAAAAVAWVRNHIAKYGGDSAHIVVVGHSAGAYLAALLATDPRYLTAHHMTSRELRGVVPVSAFMYVDRPDVAPARPKDVWGTDPNVWHDASPGAHVRKGLPPMLLIYADGDDQWRRDQQGEFAAALKHSGSPHVTTRMVSGRTHNTIWSEMAKGEDEVSRAIVESARKLH